LSQSPVTLREEDYSALDKASGGELAKLLRALNLNTQIATQATAGLSAASGLGDRFRLREGPYPTPSSPKCLLIQNRVGNTWTTVQAFDAAGRLLVQQAWQTPTLLNSWAAYGSEFASPGYYRDAAGIVRLRGAIKSGTGAAFTLPVGHRPASTIPIATVANGAFGYLTIDGAGNSTPNGSNVIFGLDGVSFRAEQ
jgi:hypothetical protein